MHCGNYWLFWEHDNKCLKRQTKETRGRPRKTTPQTDRQIVRMVKTRPFATSTEIKKDLGLDVNTSTTRRRLIENKLSSRSPRKCPLLTKRNAQRRKKIAQEHLNWPKEKWRNILWSDESKINLFGADGGKTYVRKPKGKEYSPQYTLKTVKNGGGSVMVWGCFSWYGVGPIFWIKNIMNAVDYINILENVMLPFAEEEMLLRWTFQQDNYPKRTSKVEKSFFERNNVDVMEWPAQTPNLNPIKNLWAYVKRTLGHSRHTN